MKYLATIVCLIDADDETVWDVAEHLADGLDSEVVWVDSIAETDEFEDEVDDHFDDERNEEDYRN